MPKIQKIANLLTEIDAVAGQAFGGLDILPFPPSLTGWEPGRDEVKIDVLHRSIGAIDDNSKCVNASDALHVNGHAAGGGDATGDAPSASVGQALNERVGHGSAPGDAGVDQVVVAGDTAAAAPSSPTETGDKA
jgi:hypothetical protein